MSPGTAAPSLAALLRSAWAWAGTQPWLRRWLLGRAGLHRRQPLRLLGRRLSRPETGLLGELLAARHLRLHGRRVLYRNYRAPHGGEVDIVARHGRTLVFIEVKTRTSRVHGRPADAVTADKQRLIQRGAQDWLRRLGHPRVPFRFDIAEVLLIPGEVPRVHLMENAFTLPDSHLAGR